MQENKISLWAKFYSYKIHHVLLWILYYIFWIALYFPYYPSLKKLLVVISVYFVFNSSSFYITAYYLFPRFLYRQKYGLFFLWFGLLILSFSSGLAVVVLQLYKSSGEKYASDFHSMFMFCLVSLTTMVGLLSAAKLVFEKIRSEKKYRQLDKQRLESELQYLKAQVNPHFLFNAINSVYFLIKKDPDKAAETLIKLSDLLRFQLYDCSDEKIDIEKEIEYLKNFIALEKVRKGDKVKVHFQVDENLSGFKIAPFLLIPFLENAFKYVSNFNDRPNEINISFSRKSNLFKAEIRNSAETLNRNGVGGIGLKNVRRRLELLYPVKHDLEIKNDNGVYSVNLSLHVS